MKIISFSLTVLVIALGSLALATGARADANLNCNAYATAAVGQNHQNIVLGCGMVGPAWSDDFAGHRGWCLLPATAMPDLVREDGARTTALVQCSKTLSARGVTAPLNLQIGPVNPAEFLGLNPQPEPPKPADLFGLNPQPEPP
jgi:hypothetical protein